MPWPVTAYHDPKHGELHPPAIFLSRISPRSIPSSSGSKSCTTIINNGRVISASIIRHFSLFPPPSVINRVGNYWKLRGASDPFSIFFFFFDQRSRSSTFSFHQTRQFVMAIVSNDDELRRNLIFHEPP